MHRCPLTYTLLSSNHLRYAQQIRTPFAIYSLRTYFRYTVLDAEPVVALLL